MNRLKLTAVVLGLLAAGFAPSLRADERNKATRVTTNQPLQVQDTVLPPGQYVFKLLQPDTNQNIVSIYSADGSRLEGIVVGISAYRANADDPKLLAVSQPVGDKPAILNDWFFPGASEGLEFRVTPPTIANPRLAKSKKKAQDTTVAGG